MISSINNHKDVRIKCAIEREGCTKAKGPYKAFSFYILHSILYYFYVDNHTVARAKSLGKRARAHNKES